MIKFYFKLVVLNSSIIMLFSTLIENLDGWLRKCLQNVRKMLNNVISVKRRQADVTGSDTTSKDPQG